jgi:hypothetical protein
MIRKNVYVKSIPKGFSLCRILCLLPTPLSWALLILTWVWNLKPWGYQKYTLPGICACIVAIVGAVGREDISHREDEAQQPGHEDSQDYLEWSRAKSSLGKISLPPVEPAPQARRRHYRGELLQWNCTESFMQVNSLDPSKVWPVREEWVTGLRRPRGSQPRAMDKSASVALQNNVISSWNQTLTRMVSSPQGCADWGSRPFSIITTNVGGSPYRLPLPNVLRVNKGMLW